MNQSSEQCWKFPRVEYCIVPAEKIGDKVVRAGPLKRADGTLVQSERRSKADMESPHILLWLPGASPRYVTAFSMVGPTAITQDVQHMQGLWGKILCSLGLPPDILIWFFPLTPNE